MGTEELSNKLEAQIKRLGSIAEDALKQGCSCDIMSGWDCGHRSAQYRMIRLMESAIHTLKELAQCLSPQE